MTKRRKYDTKFKEEAVHLLISSGKRIAEVAQSLGIERSCLGRWRQEYLEALDQKAENQIKSEGIPSNLEQENRQLRKDLSVAIQEREILKKSSASSPAIRTSIRFHEGAYEHIPREDDVRGAGGSEIRGLRMASQGEGA